MTAKAEPSVPKKKATTKKAVVKKKAVIKPKALPVEIPKEPKEPKTRPAKETVPISVTALVNLALSVKGPKYLARIQRAFVNKIPKDTFKRLVEERLGKEQGKKKLDLSKVPLNALLEELGSRGKRKVKDKASKPK